MSALGNTEVVNCEVLCGCSLARFPAHFFGYNHLYDVRIESIKISEKLKIHRLSDPVILPLII